MEAYFRCELAGITEQLRSNVENNTRGVISCNFTALIYFPKSQRAYRQTGSALSTQHFFADKRLTADSAPTR